MNKRTGKTHAPDAAEDRGADQPEIVVNALPFQADSASDADPVPEAPRRSSAEVDTAEFSRLWRAGVLSSDIAVRMGLSLKQVKTLRRNLELTPRPRHFRTKRLADLAEPAAPRAVPADTIEATGGRYACLADYAARNGVTLARAQQDWHRHRAEAR